MFINLHTHKPGLKDIEIQNWDIRHPDVVAVAKYFSAGIHPWWIKDVNVDSKMAFLESHIDEVGFLALGETGLDKLIDTHIDVQKEVFGKHLILAQKCSKPLIIHAVKTHREIIEMCKQVKFDLPVIFHGFNNNLNIAKVLSEANSYFSLGGALLKPESNAAQFLKNADLKRVFFENDDKDVGIEYIYQAASEILLIGIDDLCCIVEGNFEKVFNL